MDIKDIVRETAETIREIEYLAGVPVIEEEKGDVSNRLQLGISQKKACVMVGWNGFTPQIQGATAPNGDIFGSVTVVVTVFERPVTNRSNGGGPTIMNMAKEVAKALHGASAEGMDGPMFLKRISSISELGSGSDESVVMCTVEFETKTSI